MAQFIKLLDDKYISSPGDLRSFDFSQKAEFFALDVMGDISFGSAFGFLTEDRDMHRYMEITSSSMPIMNALSAMLWLTTFIYSWPMNLALPKEGDNVGFGRLMR